MERTERVEDVAREFIDEGEATGVTAIDRQPAAPVRSARAPGGEPRSGSVPRRCVSASRARDGTRDFLELTLDAAGSQQRAHAQEEIADVHRVTRWSAGEREPWLTWRRSWEICSLRSEIARPCSESVGSVRRMSRSSVPGRRLRTVCRAIVSNDDTNPGWCRLSTPSFGAVEDGSRRKRASASLFLFC